MQHTDAMRSIKDSSRHGAASICEHSIVLTIEALSLAAVNAQQGDLRARGRVVLATAPLVHADAMGVFLAWAPRMTASATFDDAFQAGIDGVLSALKTYDPARGAFTTHAKPWIKTRVQRDAIYPHLSSWKVPEERIRMLDARDAALSIGALSIDVITRDGRSLAEEIPAPEEPSEDIDAPMLDALMQIDERLLRMATMRAEGAAIQEIADAFGLTLARVYQIFKQASEHPDLLALL